MVMGFGVHKDKRQLHGDVPGQGRGGMDSMMTVMTTMIQVNGDAALPGLPRHTHPPRDTTSFTLTL